MLATPVGDTYTVSVNTLVGNKGGVVEKITNKGIRIREKFINVRGEKDFNITDLKLPPLVQAKSGVRRDSDSDLGSPSYAMPYELQRMMRQSAPAGNSGNSGQSVGLPAPGSPITRESLIEAYTQNPGLYQSPQGAAMSPPR